MEFEYTSVAAIRAEGIDSTELPDSRARDLIRLASRRINDCTTQWFQPVWGALRLSGADSGILTAPQFIPILDIYLLSLLDPYSNTRDSYDSAEYVVHPYENEPWGRQIELFASRRGRWGGTFQERRTRFIMDQHYIADFPEGAGNVEFQGVTGWTENYKVINNRKLVAVLSVGDTSVEIDNVTGIARGDTLLIDKRILVTITGITGNVVEFEGMPQGVDEGAAIDAEVRDYGRVPLDIQRAALILAIFMRHPVGSDEEQQEEEALRLTSEKTDNYSYNLSSPGGGGGGGGGGGATTTGNRRVDQIIQRFVPPQYIGLV